MALTTEQEQMSTFLAKDMADQLNKAEDEVGKLRSDVARLEAENNQLRMRLQAIALVMRP